MTNDNLNEEKEEKKIPRLYPYKARRDIKIVNDIICEIQNDYVRIVKSYFDILYTNWTAPKALDFYGKSVDIP